MYKNIAISLFFFLGSAMLSAQVNLLPIFSDNMVLQQQTQAPIWGKSKPDKKVEIITSWDQRRYTVQADAQGNWKTEVYTPVAGGPYTITISDGKPIKLNNVMIGEVWVCSGQSNMEMHETLKSVLVDNDKWMDPLQQYLPNGYLFNLNRDYLLPIPQDELQMNHQIHQNPGWETVSE